MYRSDVYVRLSVNVKLASAVHCMSVLVSSTGVTKYSGRRSSKRLHTRTHTRTRTHTHAHTRTHTHTHTLSLSLTHTHTLSHTRTHTLVQDDKKHDDDILDAAVAKTSTPAQKLAALDWTPWPTRVQPVESTTRYIQFIFMKPHMSIYTYVYKCIYVHTYI